MQRPALRAALRSEEPIGLGPKENGQTRQRLDRIGATAAQHCQRLRRRRAHVSEPRAPRGVNERNRIRRGLTLQRKSAERTAADGTARSRE